MVISGMIPHDMAETEEIQECMVGRKEQGYSLHGSEVNFLPLYRNTKDSECLPALCSPNQESAIKCCFPMTLPGRTQVHTTEIITKIWTASVATCNLQS